VLVFSNLIPDKKIFPQSPKVFLKRFFRRKSVEFDPLEISSPTGMKTRMTVNQDLLWNEVNPEEAFELVEELGQGYL
jgi:hypothetical protein